MSNTTFQEGPTETPIMASWANDVNAVAYEDCGPTANRPAVPRKVGMMYFDTDIKMPIFCVQISPTASWVNASGEPV